MSASIPDPRLDVRDLRLVLALVRAGSTARATRILHLAQPSVSRALVTLEERLGVALFERTARGLVPTRAGERVAERALDLLGELAALERDVRAPPAPARPIRLVCECYTAYHWLPEALATLREELPGVEVQIRVEHTTSVRAALAEGAVDVALVTSPVEPSPELQVRDLMYDEFVFVVGEGHPLAARAALTVEDLETTPLFVQRAPTEAARWFVRAVFGRRRPQLQVTVVPLTETVVDLARAGMGIGLLTEWVTGPYLARGGVVARRLDVGPLERPWKLAWRPDAGDVAERLFRVLRADRSRGARPYEP